MAYRARLLPKKPKRRKPRSRKCSAAMRPTAVWSTSTVGIFSFGSVQAMSTTGRRRSQNRPSHLLVKKVGNYAVGLPFAQGADHLQPRRTIAEHPRLPVHRINANAAQHIAAETRFLPHKQGNSQRTFSSPPPRKHFHRRPLHDKLPASLKQAALRKTTKEMRKNIAENAGSCIIENIAAQEPCLQENADREILL